MATATTAATCKQQQHASLVCAALCDALPRLPLSFTQSSASVHLESSRARRRLSSATVAASARWREWRARARPDNRLVGSRLSAEQRARSTVELSRETPPRRHASSSRCRGMAATTRATSTDGPGREGARAQRGGGDRAGPLAGRDARAGIRSGASRAEPAARLRQRERAAQGGRACRAAGRAWEQREAPPDLCFVLPAADHTNDHTMSSSEPAATSAASAAPTPSALSREVGPIRQPKVSSANCTDNASARAGSRSLRLLNASPFVAVCAVQASFRHALPVWSSAPVSPFDNTYAEVYEREGIILETKHLSKARGHTFGRHAEWCDVILPKVRPHSNATQRGLRGARRRMMLTVVVILRAV